MFKIRIKQNDAKGCNQLPCSEEAVWCSRDGKGINRGAHSLMVNQSRKTGNDFTAGNSARWRSNRHAARVSYKAICTFFCFLEPKIHDDLTTSTFAFAMSDPGNPRVLPTFFTPLQTVGGRCGQALAQPLETVDMKRLWGGRGKKNVNQRMSPAREILYLATGSMRLRMSRI